MKTRIREIRESQKLTRKQLAEMAGGGITASALVKWEDGPTVPRMGWPPSGFERIGQLTVAGYDWRELQVLVDALAGD